LDEIDGIKIRALKDKEMDRTTFSQDNLGKVENNIM
jgi:hypothetical protein